MKDSRLDSNWLNLVILADALCPLLAQARAHALYISEDHGLAAASADERVKDDSLEKPGEVERFQLSDERANLLVN
jgi:hypothetical protein